DRLLAMAPAQQFIEIARAIAQIEDPTKRAAAAKAILGNAYREASPAMRANWDEIAKNTKIVAGDQIEAVDRLSTKWNVFWHNQDKAWGEWVSKQAKGLEEGQANWDKAMKAGAESRAKLFGTGPGALPTLPTAPTGPQIGAPATINDVIDPTMISQLRFYGQTLDDTSAATKRLTVANT